MLKTDLSHTIAALVCLGACSSTKDTGGTGLQLDIAMTMGSTASRIADATPTVAHAGDKVTATSSETTAEGNRFVFVVPSDTVATPGTYDIGPATPVQAGFSVPGTTGTVFYDSGTFTVSAVDWSANGRIEGTFEGLHRPADTLGLAPESSAEGSVQVTIPSQ